MSFPLSPIAVTFSLPHPTSFQGPECLCDHGYILKNGIALNCFRMGLQGTMTVEGHWTPEKTPWRTQRWEAEKSREALIGVSLLYTSAAHLKIATKGCIRVEQAIAERPRLLTTTTHPETRQGGRNAKSRRSLPRIALRLILPACIEGPGTRLAFRSLGGGGKKGMAGLLMHVHGEASFTELSKQAAIESLRTLPWERDPRLQGRIEPQVPARSPIRSISSRKQVQLVLGWWFTPT